MNKKRIINYYITEKSKLLKNFDDNIDTFRRVLTSRLGEPKTVKILIQMKKEYNKLLPDIIAINSQRNFILREIKNISIALSLVKALMHYNYSKSEISSCIFELHKEYYRKAMSKKFNFMRFLFIIFSTFPFNKIYRLVIKRYENLIKNKEGILNFRLKYVEGNGKNFDYGVDILCCPIYRMWQKYDVVEFLPYVCLFDFFKSAITNSGLVRTMTLSEGKSKCDNRFRKGRKPQNKQITKYVKI